MARKRKSSSTTDPEERERLKKLRAIQRREARKVNRVSRSGESDSRRSISSSYSDPTYQQDDYHWLRRSSAKAFAQAILNDCKDRPYWLSISRSCVGSTEPVAHVYPCSYMVRKGRVYYGFLFRDHRDLIFDQWRVQYKARKETVDRVIDARRS